MAAPAAREGFEFLERPRLLDAMPDSHGFVVYLEAPYGFGKTHLIKSWATRLESEGWRVITLTPAGRDLGSLLAGNLDVVTSAWGDVLGALWGVPTALLLDGLDGSEQLEPLLADVRGLVLLASRRPLTEPALARLASEGRLVALSGADLAFTDEETSLLLPDSTFAAEVQRRTGGWPLLIAYAARTGGLPEEAAVAKAVRAGLDEAAWQATLLLAAVRDLAPDLAGPMAEQLVRAGYATSVRGEIRLAPVVAEALLSSQTAAARAVVNASAGRLTERQRCLAYELTGDTATLAELLETAETDLERDDPHAVLRWHQLVGGEPGGRRRVRVGNALCEVGRRSEGVEELIAVASDEGLAPDLRLKGLGDAIYYLAQEPRDRPRARLLLAGSHELMAKATPARRGRFLSTASSVDFQDGDYAAAKLMVQRALEELPGGSPHRYAPLINLAVLDWNLSGDIEGRIRLQHEGLEICRVEYPDHVVGVSRDLAQLCLYLGRIDQARAYLEEGRRFGAARPLLLLEVEAMLAQLDLDLGRFPGLVEAALASGEAAVVDPVLDGVMARFVDSATRSGQPEAGVAAAGKLARIGGYTKVALALAHQVLGQEAAAAELLRSCTGSYPDREFVLAWTAASYRVSKQLEELDSLMALTTDGGAVLPYFVPLTELPADRPELGRFYPLDEVMLSGWREAAALRLPELPPLELFCLGDMSARLLGKRVPILGRQRDVLALLLLRYNREEIGAILWPETEPDKVRNNLNVQFNLLRRTLEPWGMRSYLPEEGLERADSDLWRLEAALRERRADDLLGIYTGALAPGSDVEAVLNARTLIERSVTDLLIEEAAIAPRDKAIGYLRRVLEIDRLNEEALQHLLRLLVGGGRLSEAERRFRRFESDLMQELGMEPLPATRALLER